MVNYNPSFDNNNANFVISNQNELSEIKRSKNSKNVTKKLMNLNRNLNKNTNYDSEIDDSLYSNQLLKYDEKIKKILDEDNISTISNDESGYVEIIKSNDNKSLSLSSISLHDSNNEIFLSSTLNSNQNNINNKDSLLIEEKEPISNTSLLFSDKKKKLTKKKLTKKKINTIANITPSTSENGDNFQKSIHLSNSIISNEYDNNEDTNSLLSLHETNEKRKTNTVLNEIQKMDINDKLLTEENEVPIIEVSLNNKISNDIDIDIDNKKDSLMVNKVQENEIQPVQDIQLIKDLQVQAIEPINEEENNSFNINESEIEKYDDINELKKKFKNAIKVLNEKKRGIYLYFYISKFKLN